MDQVATDIPFNGAGVLLVYEDQFIIGLRLKSPSVLAKDPTEELDFMGGRKEDADQEDPHVTAERELAEECGRKILEIDWRKRSTKLWFQGNYVTGTWCFLVTLTKNEYDNLVAADLEHDNWKDNEPRIPSGMVKPVKKEISGFVKVPIVDLLNYVKKFTATVKSSGNREFDAKGFRVNNKLKAIRIGTGQVYERALRAFNTALVEEHYDLVTQ